jgi:hypothetical protein
VRRVGKKREGVAVRVEFWVSRECARRLLKVSAGFRTEPEVLAKALFTAALEAYLPPAAKVKVIVKVDEKQTKGISHVGQIVERMRTGQR